MKKKIVTESEIDKLAKLANLPITVDQAVDLQSQVGITLEYVSTLQKLPTESTHETSQVTGLENVYREDEIDTTRILTQEQALTNAKRSDNGFFVVDAVFKE